MISKNTNTSHCQVKTVKYKDRDYKVQADKNGFKFIKVSENGKRIIIPLKILEPNDIVFDYIFNFGFQKNKNKYLEMCALLRSSLNKEFTLNTQKEKLQITEDWKEFLQIANQLNKEFKLNKLNN